MRVLIHVVNMVVITGLVWDVFSRVSCGSSGFTAGLFVFVRFRYGLYVGPGGLRAWGHGCSLNPSKTRESNA